MTGKELERLLADASGLSASDLDVRGRNLRRSKQVPSGGRGPHAPDYGPEHISRFLLACAASEDPGSAALAAMEYANLGVGDFFSSGLLGAGTLAKALANIIASADLTNRVRKVRVCRSYHIAEIVWDDPKDMHSFFFPKNERNFDPSKVGLGTLTNWAEIGRGLIINIQLRIGERDEVKATWAAVGDG